EGGRRRIDLMATTSTARAPKLTKKELEKYRRLLEEKKTGLSADLAKARDAEEETTEEATQDIADKAVSSYTREFLYSLSDSDRTTLLQIDEALTRIEESSYGLCLNCSTPMAEKRLLAVPWTPYCIDCQELSEKGLLEN
ncbi:MAG TPA: TraR/DksA family transcriptional regulator, partial [Thermoanaerobaculia bacterium]